MTARPPDAVLAAAREPGGLDVLGDWYEDRGELFWAQWFRASLAPDVRRERLYDALPKLLPRAAFQEVGWGALRLEQAPLGEPFWDALVWSVHDPGRLPDVLAWPPLLLGPRSIHLRFSPSRVGPMEEQRRVDLVRALLEAWPDVRELEAGVALPCELVRGMPALEVLSGVLADASSVELGVRALRLSDASPATLRQHAVVRTPRLQRLELVGGFPESSRDWEPALLALVSDRPLQVLETPHLEVASRVMRRALRSDVRVEPPTLPRGNARWWSLAV